MNFQHFKKGSQNEKFSEFFKDSFLNDVTQVGERRGKYFVDTMHKDVIKIDIL